MAQRVQDTPPDWSWAPNISVRKGASSPEGCQNSDSALNRVFDTLQGRDIIAASFSHSFPYDAARLELDFHLADWRGKQAGASAIVVD
jgi:hypothetical protein